MCSCQNSTFAPVKDTWTVKSDLTMGGYDPYPELSKTQTRENYGCKAGYSLGSWPTVQQAIPMSQNSYSMHLKPIKEGYDQDTRKPYVDAKNAWSVKSKYQL